MNSVVLLADKERKLRLERFPGIRVSVKKKITFFKSKYKVVLLAFLKSFTKKMCNCIIPLQTEVVTSMKALSRLVDATQLSSHFDGSLAHSHCDWMELHQVRQSNHHCTASFVLPCSRFIHFHILLFRNSSHLCLTSMRLRDSSTGPSESWTILRGRTARRYVHAVKWKQFSFSLGL